MSKIETLSYALVMQEKTFEIREYQAFYVVEYHFAPDPEINKAFQTLFAYISGQNEPKQKIAMTAPVLIDTSGTHKKMAFVMPQKYQHAIPMPNHPSLNVKREASGRFSVVRYRGITNRKVEAEKTEELRNWTTQKGLTITSSPMFAFYNPPYTLPILRRNEVMMRIS